MPLTYVDPEIFYREGNDEPVYYEYGDHNDCVLEDHYQVSDWDSMSGYTSFEICDVAYILGIRASEVGHKEVLARAFADAREKDLTFLEWLQVHAERGEIELSEGEG